MVDQHDDFRKVVKETVDKMGVINQKGGIDCKGHDLTELQFFNERCSQIARQAKFHVNVMLASGEKADKCIKHFEAEVQISCKRAELYQQQTKEIYLQHEKALEYYCMNNNESTKQMLKVPEDSKLSLHSAGFLQIFANFYKEVYKALPPTTI